jgi:TolB protein
VFVGVLLSVSAASAQVVGRIVGPGETRVRIAISPLLEAEGAGGLGDRFAAILARNLELSGYFQILDRRAYIEGPSPTDLDKINFANWNVIGARALVKGSVAASGTTVELEAKLFDVAGRAQLGGNRYRGSREDVARMARKFADSILEMLTGQAGPFDSKIAFVSRRGGRAKELWVMSVDGEEVAQLTHNRTINLAPSWSPDAASILFTSFQDGNPSLYSISAAGRGERRLSDVRGLNLGGRWSPDGRRIAISLEINGNSDIYLLNPSGGIEKRLTDHPEIDVSPVWSPDGQEIAFVSSRSGGPQIYVMRADGSNVRRLTFQGSYNTSPAWSPKGDWIAYVGRDGRFDIFLVQVQTRDTRAVTSGPGDNEDPSFSPDGRYLVFASTRKGSSTLFLSDLTGSHQVQLTTGGGDDSSPAWSPRLP